MMNHEDANVKLVQHKETQGFTGSARSKSNFYYTRDITPKLVTSGGIHLRGLAPEQHSSEETSQRWRTVGDNVSDLTSPGIDTTPPAPYTKQLIQVNFELLPRTDRR